MNDIHSITLESIENGYTLVVEADFGSVTGALNDLDVMRQLIVAAKHAQSYIDSHDEARDAYSAWARATRAAYETRDAYDPRDPKHPDLFDTMVDIARTDDRLHQEGLK